MTEVQVLCVGAANYDTIAVVERMPGADERILGERVLEAGGGPAATAAVALARQGVSVGFCGVVGRDPIGDRVVESLEAEGVDLRWMRRDRELVTPRAVILVAQDTATRTIIAERTITPLPSDVPLTVSDWIHVDQTGYAAIAGRTGPGTGRVSLDAGNAVADLRLSDIDLYAPTVARLRERFPDGDLAASFAAANAHGPSSVVATDGEHGSWWSLGSGVGHVPAFDVSVVSTLGAGDVFHGGLLAGVVQGLPLAEAVRRASAIAALSCRALDGRSGIPAPEEVEEFLRDRTSAHPAPATAASSITIKE